METIERTTLPRSVVQVKRLQRASRALEVLPVNPTAGRYMVESATYPGELYEVTLSDGGTTGRCSCPWGQHGGTNCKHILAAMRAHHAGQGALSFWRAEGDARRQHRRILAGDGLYITLRPRR